MSTYEVAIIGGGPTGLAAALVLGRARRRVIVVDSGEPRNAASPGVQGFLSRDGILPAELKRIARDQIAAYETIQFSNGRAQSVVRLGNGRGFVIGVDEAPVLGARLVLLATGMIDLLPEIEGFRSLWGRRVIHCEFCHGWENTGRRWGIIAMQREDLETASRFRNWTDSIIVFASHELVTPRTRRSLAREGIEIEHRPIRRLIASRGELDAVGLEDGTRISCGTLVCRPKQRQTDLVMSSGVELDENGRVDVDGHHETSIQGIYAGGDLAPGPQDAPTAAAVGGAIGRRMAFVLSTRHNGPFNTRADTQHQIPMQHNGSMGSRELPSCGF